MQKYFIQTEGQNTLVIKVETDMGQDVDFTNKTCTAEFKQGQQVVQSGVYGTATGELIVTIPENFLSTGVWSMRIKVEDMTGNVEYIPNRASFIIVAQ